MEIWETATAPPSIFVTALVELLFPVFFPRKIKKNYRGMCLYIRVVCFVTLGRQMWETRQWDFTSLFIRNKVVFTNVFTLREPASEINSIKRHPPYPLCFYPDNWWETFVFCWLSSYIKTSSHLPDIFICQRIFSSILPIQFALPTTWTQFFFY